MSLHVLEQTNDDDDNETQQLATKYTGEGQWCDSKHFPCNYSFSTGNLNNNFNWKESEYITLILTLNQKNCIALTL